ncbi:MAG: DMT family transporter [Hyphomicrobiaceae bacterium]
MKEGAAIASTAAGQQRSPWLALVAISGFIGIAFAQVTNMILARALAGSVPPFSLAFFRWLIIAIGIAPFVLTELREKYHQITGHWWLIVIAGFLGMFLCGAPIYVAGVSTTAINIALIMALSPILVLLISVVLGLEKVKLTQVLGVALALVGALIIISKGDLRTFTHFSTVRGDLFVLIAMIGWSGYTLLQSRIVTELSFFARVCMFSAAGALLCLPFAIGEAWSAPHSVFNQRAAGAYLLAGIVPGLIAYAGFAYMGGRFGSVRASLVMYLGPIASALLSFAVLGEPPTIIHAIGGVLILTGVWASLRK